MYIATTKGIEYQQSSPLTVPSSLKEQPDFLVQNRIIAADGHCFKLDGMRGGMMDSIKLEGASIIPLSGSVVNNSKQMDTVSSLKECEGDDGFHQA